MLGVAAGTILTALAVLRSGGLARWSSLPLAIGFTLFIPQFFGTPLIRVAHGALVLVGCARLAYELWRVVAARTAQATWPVVLLPEYARSAATTRVT